MKIGPEHIHQQVENGAYVITVLAVGETMFFGRRDDGSESSFYRDVSDSKVCGLNGGWRIIESKKKPSDLILERTGVKRSELLGFNKAVLDYLDEEATARENQR